MAMTENSLRQPMRFVVDLSAGLVQQPIRPQLMKGDKRANAIIVKLTNGSEIVDLTGVEVTGSFISPVESAELPLPGEAVGDEARVTLLDQCYAEDGFFECSVKLKLGGTERTILSITGNVLSKGSGAYIDVGDVIPSIDDIIAQYAEMKRVTEGVQAAAGSASTAAGNANTAAGKANAAAAKIDNMTVSAADGTSAGATISEKNGALHIDFTLPKGEKGEKGDPGNGKGTVTGIKVDEQTYQPDGAGVVTLPKMGGGAEIDDTTPSANNVYSSQKTQYELNQLSEQKADKDGVLRSDPNEDSGETPEMGSVPNHADTAGKAYDADKLGGKTASEFLGANDTAKDSEKLGGVNASGYALKTDTAPNSEKLGGVEPAGYVRHDELAVMVKTVTLEHQSDVSGGGNAQWTYTLDIPDGYTAHVLSVHIINTTNNAYGKVSFTFDFTLPTLKVSVFNGNESGVVKPNPKCTYMLVKEVG